MSESSQKIQSQQIIKKQESSSNTYYSHQHIRESQSQGTAQSPLDFEDFVIESEVIHNSPQSYSQKAIQQIVEITQLRKTLSTKTKIGQRNSQSPKRVQKNNSIRIIQQSFEAQYVQIEMLKFNQFLKIIKCKKFMGNQNRIAKVYFYSFANDYYDCAREIRILSLLTKYPQKYIAKLEQVLYQQQETIIIVEGSDGQSLQQMINSNYYFHIDNIKRIIKRLLKAVQHLHGLGILHRDIKPEIIYFQKKGNHSQLKLTDFSSACCMNDKNHTQFIQNSIYNSTELFDLDLDYDESCDIYSIGVILLQLSLKQKFIDIVGNNNQALDQNQIQQLLSSVSNLELRSIAQKMICQNSTIKWLAKDCLNHDFFQRNQDEDIQLEEKHIAHLTDFPSFKNPFTSQASL